MARIWSLPRLTRLAGGVRHIARLLIAAALLSCVVGAACSNASVPAFADEPTSSHGYDESSSVYDATTAASGTEEPFDYRRCRRYDGTSNLARTRSPSERPGLATREGGKELTRIRHYTNRAGSEGVERDRVIRACDQGAVFCESARRNPLSPHDADVKAG